MSVREHGQVGDPRHTATHDTPETLPANEAWHFALKGSPRHYDDVRNIINGSNEAIVYFGEALTYERPEVWAARLRLAADSAAALERVVAGG